MNVLLLRALERSPEMYKFKRGRHQRRSERRLFDIVSYQFRSSLGATCGVRYGLVILNVARSDAVARKRRRARRGRRIVRIRCGMLHRY